MAKILVVDDETDLEVLIKQKFRKQIRNNNTNSCLHTTGWKPWKNWPRNLRWTSY
jgi:hypothetical protein